MRALDTALEWLRPLVETMTWDYCIVWQFGDDPSRYIEWNGCCCNGRQSVCRIVKEEVDVTGHDVSTLCRDTYVKHSVNSKACLKLANIPFHLPLYSGIHGEVAMSGQPSWSHDDIGTQVLIPVDGGMIELYISTHVTRDQQMVDALMAQFNIFSQHVGRIKTEHSPNCSVPTLASAAGSTHVSPTQSVDNKPTNLLGKKQAKTKQKNGKDQYHSKNLVTERNRRNRIKDNLFTLRSLVPNISKMDRASIVGDAIDYIKKLQTNIQELKDELEKLEEDDDKSNLDEIEVCKPKKASPTKKHSHESTPSDKKSEVQVEVHQIGAKNFLVKLVCGAQQGGFSRLIETVNSLELQVIDVNVTTYYGKVMNILQIEAKGKNFAAKNLKESLLESLLPGMVDDNTTRSD